MNQLDGIFLLASSDDLSRRARIGPSMKLAFLNLCVACEGEGCIGRFLLSWSTRDEVLLLLPSLLYSPARTTLTQPWHAHCFQIDLLQGEGKTTLIQFPFDCRRLQGQQDWSGQCGRPLQHSTREGIWYNRTCDFDQDGPFRWPLFFARPGYYTLLPLDTLSYGFATIHIIHD